MTEWYGIEDQVNNCFSYLGIKEKDAHEMDEGELIEAQLFLEQYFYWVPLEGYVQYVPKHRKTGEIILLRYATAEELANAEPLFPPSLREQLRKSYPETEGNEVDMNEGN